MDGIQVYALWSAPLSACEMPMRKIGSVVPTFNEANLIVGLYPKMLNDLGIEVICEYYAIRGSTMYAFIATEWKEVE